MQQTYVREEPGKGEASVPSKGPQLTGCRGHFGDGRGRQSENQNSSHGVGARQTLGGVVEHLDEGVAGRRGQDLVDIAQREAHGDQHEEARAGVDQDGSDHSLRQSLGGVLDFFGHVHGAIVSDQRRDRRGESHQRGHSVAAPVTTIVELGEHLFRAATGSQDPEGDDDGEQSAHVENENDDLDEGELLRQEGVEQDREQRQSNHQQRSVPALKAVVLVVQHDQTLDDGSSQEGDGDNSTLPSHGTEPT